MDFIKRHRIVVFFVLAYALAWGAIPWNSFFAPGVLLAALIVVTLTEGLSGLKALGSRLIRWRVSWVWYALAIGVPLLVHLASVAINVGLGAPPPSLGMLSPWYSLPMAIALHALSPTGGPLMEEPSFRGYRPARAAGRPFAHRGDGDHGGAGHRLACARCSSCRCSTRTRSGP